MRVGSFVRLICMLIAGAPTSAFAWGAVGHRTVAAIAVRLLPPAKVAKMSAIMASLEKDNDVIDGASYPDEYLRNAAPQFNNWHFADLPDDGSRYDCKNDCLFYALDKELAVVREGNGDKAEAVALAWVIHLVGDLHQPLHMTGRDKGGNHFAVTYRGQDTCIGTAHVELHSVWDDCLVGELANGRSPDALAKDLLGDITTYSSRPEIASAGATPWFQWGDESHALANGVGFDHLQKGQDLGDAYILGDSGAIATVKRQLLTAGIRLAYLLDKNFR